MQLDNGVLEPPPRLTERQAEVLSFIWRFFHASETYPTHREIAHGIGAQSTNVGPWVNALVRKGVLAKNARVSVRKIRLTSEGLRYLRRAGYIPTADQLEF